MGKTYLTFQKRRKNERKILSVKNEYVEPFKHATTHQLKCGPPSTRNCTTSQVLRKYSLVPHTQQHYYNTASNGSDENNEHCFQSVSSESRNNSHASHNPEIDLDSNCSVCPADDHEPYSWKFSFYPLELPDIHATGMENDLMTVNPVNNPFHYMSAPVLSAFGLDFPNTLVELRNSYVNLMQSLGINGKWFLLPSDGNLILISKHGFNSSSAPVITMTIEIHHSQHWFLRHVARIIMQHQHPLLATLPTSLQSGHDIKTVTDTIDECCHCKGINDPKYYPLVLKNNGKFYDYKGLWLLNVCIYYYYILGEKLLVYYDHNQCTIRHVDCHHIFTTPDYRYSTSQCNVCRKYQRNVMNSALLARHNKPADGISPGRSSGESHTNYRHCNTAKTRERLTTLHHTLRLQKRALQHLEDKMAKIISDPGV